MTENLVFKEVDGQSLTGDLYQPTSGSSLPAVVVVHGGGWARRSGDMKSVCEELVRAGFVVFSITYRLAPQHTYPTAVDDVRDGILWFKKNAHQYRVNPDRVGAWGYSAGAHLALMAGLDSRVGLSAIVSGGTPADLTVWPKSPLVLKFLSVARDTNPSLWAEASPINHVTKDSPPVFLYHGEWDKLVEFEQMEKMARALKEKGRPVETHAVPFLGHLGVYFLSQKSVDLGIQFLKQKL